MAAGLRTSNFVVQAQREVLLAAWRSITGPCTVRGLKTVEHVFQCAKQLVMHEVASGGWCIIGKW